MAEFTWDTNKDRSNQEKHDVSFRVAQEAFFDTKRVLAEDLTHRSEEDRFYCMGRVGGRVLTVRFTYRDSTIRILGAGYWRKGRKLYEEKNKVHR